MPVNTRKSEYTKFAGKWEKVRDCVNGQDRIKSKGTEYLPSLSGQEPSEYNKYLFRAQFIDFTKRAHNTAVGQIFRKPPIKNGIDQEYIDNIDLCGTNFDYFFRQNASEIITVNWVGILVDYSKEQKRPFLSLYKAESIINWHTGIIDGIEKLTMVVLEGEVEVPKSNDKFVMEKKPMWKILYLEDGVYKVDIIEKGEKDSFNLIETLIPEKNGSVLTKIPFYFVTSNGISTKLSNSVLLSMTNLNLGHYRNSADYENMLFFTGCKTVATKGWTVEAGVKFPLGSIVKLPADGDVKYLEASSDSGLKDELRNIIEMMAVLSSSFLASQGRYVASAETARLTSEGEFATLADISNALSVSTNTIMSFFMEWATGKESDVDVSFNTDFVAATIEPTLLTSLMGAVGSGLMSFQTYYYNLSSKEMYMPNWTIEDERLAIEEDEKERLAKDDKVVENDFLPE